MAARALPIVVECHHALREERLDNNGDCVRRVSVPTLSHTGEVDPLPLSAITMSHAATSALVCYLSSSRCVAIGADDLLKTSVTVRFLSVS
jgi:hypothetical protein